MNVTYIDARGRRVDPWGNVVGAEAAVEEPETVDLETADPADLSATDLKKLASMLEIEGRSKMNSDELRAAIVARRGESEGSGGNDDGDTAGGENSQE